MGGTRRALVAKLSERAFTIERRRLEIYDHENVGLAFRAYLPSNEHGRSAKRRILEHRSQLAPRVTSLAIAKRGK